MKITLIVSVILYIILLTTAQKSNELASEISQNSSNYQKGTVANKTEFNTETSHLSLEYLKGAVTNKTELVTENSYQLANRQTGIVTNNTESHHLFSTIRFWPNLFPVIVKTRRWISSYSFGNDLNINLSEDATVEQGYSKIQAITVSTSVINKDFSHDPSEIQKGTVTNETELTTETSHDPFENQEGIVPNKRESHHFSLFRFLLHSFSNIFNPRRWISSHSLGNGIDNKKVTTDHDNSKGQDNKVASVDKGSTPHVLYDRFAKLQRSDSSNDQTGVHFRFSPLRFWFLLKPQHLRRHVVGSPNLQENETTIAETGKDKVNPPHKLHVRLEKLRRFDSSNFQAGSHSHNTPLHLWLFPKPNLHLSSRVVGSPNLNKNETTTTMTQTISAKAAGSYGILITMRKRSHECLHRFLHIKWIFWKSVLYFIFKGLIHVLAIVGLVLLLYSLFSMKNNTQPIKKKKSNQVAYYLIV